MDMRDERLKLANSVVRAYGEEHFGKHFSDVRRDGHGYKIDVPGQGASTREFIVGSVYVKIILPGCLFHGGPMKDLASRLKVALARAERIMLLQLDGLEIEAFIKAPMLFPTDDLDIYFARGYSSDSYNLILASYMYCDPPVRMELSEAPVIYV
jgi:hypothetical protein